MRRPRQQRGKAREERVSTVGTPDASSRRRRTNQDGGKERSVELKERHFGQGGKKKTFTYQATNIELTRKIASLTEQNSVRFRNTG